MILCGLAWVLTWFSRGFRLLPKQLLKANDSSRIGGQNPGELPHPPVAEPLRQGAERTSCYGASLRCFKRRSQSTSPPRSRACNCSPPGLHSSVVAKGQPKWEPEVENLRISNCSGPCTRSTRRHSGVDADSAARFARNGALRSCTPTYTHSRSAGTRSEARVQFLLSRAISPIGVPCPLHMDQGH